MLLLEKYRKLRDWYQLIYNGKWKVDLGVRIKIPFLTKIKFNLLGFRDEDYFVFNLKENDYRNYISYKERYRLEFINGRFADILGEKVMFERIFGNFVNVPHIYCWEKNGEFIDINLGNKISLTKLLRDKLKIIAKPTRSMGGGVAVYMF